MADVQAQFKAFHKAIKLTYDDDKVLRDTRDDVLDRLSSRLKVLFEQKGQKTPKFEKFDQGSYAMCTGIKPLGTNHDIDTGLRFTIDKDDHPDPVKIKEWVFDALDNETINADSTSKEVLKVKVRRPCVTVYVYDKDGETLLRHVDLAIYAADNKDKKLYLAKGMQQSLPGNRFWQVADPFGLMEKVDKRFSGEEKDQFLRVVRYLKRWRDFRFSSEGNEAPIGVGLTFAAYKWFQGKTKPFDAWAGSTERDDLEALLSLVTTMSNNFQMIYRFDSQKFVHRLDVTLPVEPGGDLFEKMSDNHMANFKARLEALKTTLETARDEVDPVKACTALVKQLSTDFPVPIAKSTSYADGAGVIGSSSSG